MAKLAHAKRDAAFQLVVNARMPVGVLERRSDADADADGERERGGIIVPSPEWYLARLIEIP